MNDSRENEHGGLFALLAEHDPCVWEQVGMCVYCTNHNVRLYQGDLPADRRSVPICTTHDWDEEQGLGFYFICTVCGFREWPED